MIETFILFLSIRGRITFLQLGRYGKYVIAFDSSFINKSGKTTPGLNWYWSGFANQAKWGLEIGGLAAIDIDNHTAFHLEAVQTLNTDDQTLTDWYAGELKG